MTAADQNSEDPSRPGARSNCVRIGGASGFWGDAALAVPQLLRGGELDYLVFDYLAEITMSITARARVADPSKGYATDFVTAALAPNIDGIVAGGVKVISNAGGVNPEACAEAIRDLLRERGHDLTVAVVLGDDLADRVDEFTDAREMFSGESFPPAEKVASINAYLGAFPIAAALTAGADIVVTGRCVDSAVTLAACIHAFDWSPRDYDLLAQGSLAGHLLECGTQATGGNFTDWDTVEDLVNAGYPIAEVCADGGFTISKAEPTGGLVSVGTVGEQLLYEIGDPSCYYLPDVICDFTQVTLTQVADNRIAVAGASGRGAPNDYKVSVTWADGYRAGQIWTLYGRDAKRKAEALGQSVFERTRSALERHKLGPLTEQSLELLGTEGHFGKQARAANTRELDIKLAVKHPSARGVGVFLKEMVGLALTAPPGLTTFAGARPKPTPVVRLFSFQLDRREVPVRVIVGDEEIPYEDADSDQVGEHKTRGIGRDELSAFPVPDDDAVFVDLIELAYGRSGDKGDKANIGLMARHPEFLPVIAAFFTPERVTEYFSHFLQADQEHPVERFHLPGIHALNFLLHKVLGGGGVASLRADPQGKGYAQLLLAEQVPVPRELAERHGLPVSS